MTAAVSFFGIRHHGPGSARRLVGALDALAPATVLIEGPADASDLLPLLADPDMVPPVALLTYAEDNPADASFFPFAAWSPEYRAVLWAVRHGAALRFIDLPASDRLTTAEEALDAETMDAITRDPIGALAEAAGYADGESWWSDVIEQNPAPGSVFAAVADAMTALRSSDRPLSEHEAAREAHMRLEIARAVKDSDGPIAVICGAWHVPALAEKRNLAADRDILKGRSKVKVRATWAPWTSPRLARGSGYGAGVAAPGWCAHLWESGDADHRDSVWLTRVARLLRDRGHFVSTASVIEAQRLGLALAALRGRPTAGFEELRDASIACLCFGERLVWDEIAAELLIGADVGVIPASTPLAPLLEDLQRQQRATRLKPEALERELTLDLRSDAGLARSKLLHRLAALDVPWGRLADAGRSRGTFRENWQLCWQPEFAVRLVENLVYGATIAEAAAARVIAAMQDEVDLGSLAGLVRTAMLADLKPAAEFGIGTLETRAALTSDCGMLLKTLPPMADIVRYGEARVGTAEHLSSLMPRIVIQAALALPYAARSLDAEAADALRSAIVAAENAIQLAELPPETSDRWRHALGQLLNDPQTARLIAGLAARLLYEADRLTAEAAADLLGQMLSPGTPVADAASFFEGFFGGSAGRLIHDAPLRTAVDAWLLSLDEDAFTASLPLFRRVFSALDRSERRRLFDAVFDKAARDAPSYRLLTGASEMWPAHFARIAGILDGGVS